MRSDPSLTGVAGWLGVLAFGLLVVAPLFGFSRMLGEFAFAEYSSPGLSSSERWASYKFAMYCTLAIAIAFCINGGWRLWKVHNSDSVRWARYALWIAGPVAAVVQAIVTMTILGPLPDEVASQLAAGTVSSAAAATVWTLYLNRSLRVRNTYHLPFVEGTAPKSEGWWRRRSKRFRVWVFASLCWAPAVGLYVIMSHRYGNYLTGADVAELLFLILAPPLLTGAAAYAYDRYVR